MGCTIMFRFSLHVTQESGLGMVVSNSSIMIKQIWESKIIHSDTVLLAARRQYITVNWMIDRLCIVYQAGTQPSLLAVFSDLKLPPHTLQRCFSAQTESPIACSLQRSLSQDSSLSLPPRTVPISFLCSCYAIYSTASLQCTV